MEVWKQYSGTYYVSNQGRIKNINWHNSGKEKELKLNDVQGGYLQFYYYENGVKKQQYISVAVYESFVGETPKGYDVHHINHNRQDNRVENLCLIKSNIHKSIHAKENYCNNKNNLDQSKPILQFTKDGQFVAEYQSAIEAERQTNTDHSNILKCCNGKRKTANGFIWRYKL